jgi:(p)ppGpp synthase/HD superfamily hydrolase
MARHEVEHGWQYFLRSRIASPVTEWEEFINTTFGKIKSKKLIREARRYAKSIKNYVALTKELEEAGKVQEYKDNYIEVKARKAGQKARTDYDKQGKSIRNSFKHIPKEYL